MPLPAVAIAPATSSRYFEAAAIMARTESLTVEGACPSAQLIEPSAVALLAAVRDHFQQPHCRTSKASGPFRGRRFGYRVELAPARGLINAQPSPNGCRRRSVNGSVVTSYGMKLGPKLVVPGVVTGIVGPGVVVPPGLVGLARAAVAAAARLSSSSLYAWARNAPHISNS